MKSNYSNIPVNVMDDNFIHGITMDRNNIKSADFTNALLEDKAGESHRDEGFTFHILEKGKVVIEIDFQTYQVSAPSVVFLHPDQVHRMREIDNIVVCSISIDSESLNPIYLKILEEITPTVPMKLDTEAFSVITTHFSLSLDLYLKNRSKLYHTLIKDSCNTLVGLLLSGFINQEKKEDFFSRFDIVTKSFRKLLEENYNNLKRPGEYASLLNISTPYLNECIKNATGYTASQIIQERIILEAKRMLYHTQKSVKEIAFDLGYPDYPYFSRMFSKATGFTPTAFKGKNLD